MGTINEHEIIKTKLEIQEQALKYTVHEIHDNIGQVLSLAKLHLGTLDFARPDEVAQKTHYSNQLLGKAIKDLRNLARHLDAEQIDRIGLLKAIDYELACIPPGRSANPLLQTSGKLPLLSADEELMLFRIIQESIHCFLGLHADSQISVTLKCFADHLTIGITDRDQQREDEEALHLPAGYVARIYNRAQLVGAQLDIDRKDSRETIIHITLPLSNKTG